MQEISMVSEDPGVMP